MSNWLVIADAYVEAPLFWEFRVMCELQTDQRHKQSYKKLAQTELHLGVAQSDDASSWLILSAASAWKFSKHHVMDTRQQPVTENILREAVEPSDNLQ